MKLIPSNSTQSQRRAARLDFGAAVAGSLLALLLLAAPVPARGQIFVSNLGGDSIGEYTTSGATVNAPLVSGLTDPTGIAVEQPAPQMSVPEDLYTLIVPVAANAVKRGVDARQWTCDF